LFFRHPGFRLMPLLALAGGKGPLAGYAGWYVRHRVQPRGDKRRGEIHLAPRRRKSATPPPNGCASPMHGGGQTDPERGGQVGVRSASRLRILCIRPAHPDATQPGQLRPPCKPNQISRDMPRYRLGLPHRGHDPRLAANSKPQLLHLNCAAATTGVGRSVEAGVASICSAGLPISGQ